MGTREPSGGARSPLSTARAIHRHHLVNHLVSLTQLCLLLWCGQRLVVQFLFRFGKQHSVASPVRFKFLGGSKSGNHFFDSSGLIQTTRTSIEKNGKLLSRR